MVGFLLFCLIILFCCKFFSLKNNLLISFLIICFNYLINKMSKYSKKKKKNVHQNLQESSQLLPPKTPKYSAYKKLNQWSFAIFASHMAETINWLLKMVSLCDFIKLSEKFVTNTKCQEDKGLNTRQRFVPDINHMPLCSVFKGAWDHECLRFCCPGSPSFSVFMCICFVF